jgi:hypothetical protein
LRLSYVVCRDAMGFAHGRWFGRPPGLRGDYLEVQGGEIPEHAAPAPTGPVPEVIARLRAKMAQLDE